MRENTQLYDSIVSSFMRPPSNCCSFHSAVRLLLGVDTAS